MRDKSNYKHYENVSIRPQMETLTFQAEMMGVSKEELAMMGMPGDPENEQMYVATIGNRDSKEKLSV